MRLFNYVDHLDNVPDVDTIGLLLAVVLVVCALGLAYIADIAVVAVAAKLPESARRVLTRHPTGLGNAICGLFMLGIFAVGMWLF